MSVARHEVDLDHIEKYLSTTSELLEDMRNGRMIILVDAQDRENEGDLVIPAQMATPDAVNFMAKYGRGLICLTLSHVRAGELRLEQMVRNNAARNRTAFTQSIEAREGISTGISAHDRALTIATAIDPTRTHEDIVSPGHVFPLVAREGGVLVRAGHTEASVDLSRMAGLLPAAVICEIMNDDGTMARLPDLVAFAQHHGLKLGTIEDLISYRLKNDCIVKPRMETEIQSAFAGTLKLHVYETIAEPAEHLAFVKGDLSVPGPVLVRVHAVNPLLDLAGMGADAEEGGSLVEKSLRAIHKEGRGVVVLIRNPAPRSVSSWIESNLMPQDRKTVKQASGRRQLEIGVGSQILANLGVSDMILLTNSPKDVYVGLEAFGLRVVDTRRID